MSDDEIPERYKPESRVEKDKLYELYWGEEMLSTREVAERLEYSYKFIIKKMNEFGIPRRGPNGASEPFEKFYHNEPQRGTAESMQSNKDNDWERTKSRHREGWQKEARNSEAISDKAILNND